MTQAILPSPAADQASRSLALAQLWALLNEGGAGSSTKHREPTRLDNHSAYSLVKRGIPSKAIAPLGEVLGVGKAAVAAYLDLDRSTANRRAARDQLLPTHAAEGVVRFIELDQMACETFASDAEASQWLRKPHPMLESETPLEAAKTGYGMQRVRDILLAARYGGVV